MERERDERLQAAGLVLERARAEHVIHPLLDRLDVPVEHRDVGAHPEAVREPVDREVAVGAALVVADLLPHALSEHFRAAARQRIEPGRLELPQDLLVGLPVQVREEGDLDSGEALQVDLRTNPLEAAEHVRVVGEGQIRMEAVHDVDFGQRLPVALAQLVPRLLERHRVRPGVARTEPRERAEQAARDADVGRLEPDVEVVIRARPVPLLALAVREPAEGERVGTVEQAHAVLEAQTDALVELFGDSVEAAVENPLQHCCLSPSTFGLLPSAFYLVVF